ncbi:S-layer homology domain-containing protein [Paenibacillus sp. GP183]|uniref:S-layer homology domain-containing protein n=1 Tax=Paenibacillus sp. GP183 TaxID=1882751 RepID=UPI0008960E5C|nr:S-layer homology domain-containing protein [Paenibacillus sp. GP183]SEB46286.1 S-layer homology domain-containing protein [Paenibacillus sp. GP183]
MFLNVEPLKDGPHNITIFTSRPNSDNQRMISRDILINRNDSFSDVPQSHWAHDDIERLHGFGIIEGRTVGSFQPDQLVTRQEFLKMLVMTAKSEAKQQSLIFTDVPTEPWSKPYIDRGSSAGLIDGEFSSGRRMFYPNRTITRLEAIAMMARTDRLSSLPQPHESIPGIEDRSTIQPWGISFVEKLFYYRWIHGYDDHTFRPDVPLTRAEAATLLTSFTHDSNFPQNEGLLGYLNSVHNGYIK